MSAPVRRRPILCAPAAKYVDASSTVPWKPVAQSARRQSPTPVKFHMLFSIDGCDAFSSNASVLGLVNAQKVEAARVSANRLGRKRRWAPGSRTHKELL